MVNFIGFSLELWQLFMYVGPLCEFVTCVAYNFNDGVLIDPRSVGQRGVCVAATVGDHAAGSVCAVDAQFFHQGVELTISPVVNANPMPTRTGDQVVLLASCKVKRKHIRHDLGNQGNDSLFTGIGFTAPGKKEMVLQADIAFLYFKKFFRPQAGEDKNKNFSCSTRKTLVGLSIQKKP